MMRWKAEPDPEQFLRDYWQRQPCLLRQALDVHEFPLDGDDLAGLACEELAASRLIEGPDARGAWQLRHGPFTEADFADIGAQNWTLLVQDVEKHFPPLRAWLAPFDFLPRWRFDDLMLSFAAPGGSVGPHVDQYDVFLLQVSGRRRWEISTKFDPQKRSDVPLDMLHQFQPETDWTLDAGDMLYLPPGIAHYGVAQDPCLTLSVGFRAPSNADLFLALGEFLSTQDSEGGRYTDPALSPHSSGSEINAAALDQFRSLMRHVLENKEQTNLMLAKFMSTYRQAHEPASPPEPLSRASLQAHLNQGKTLLPHPWTRMNWIQNPDGSATLFTSGQIFNATPRMARLVCELPESVGSLSEDEDLNLLLTLVNAGQLIVPSNG